MTLTGYRSRNHPQQVAVTGAKSEVDDRATHPQHFAQLDEEFGPFTLDVAAAAHNAKCDRYFDVATDGLRQSWAGERVWCNPPYSSTEPWVRKAWAEHERTLGVVMLLPGNRAEQKWWQTLVEPHRDRPGSVLTTKFLPGRTRFTRRGCTDVGPSERPPFGCVLLTWRGEERPTAADNNRQEASA